ncbi:hypothetical protein C0J52_27121, partial [Blattella germanica]
LFFFFSLLQFFSVLKVRKCQYADINVQVKSGLEMLQESRDTSRGGVEEHVGISGNVESAEVAFIRPEPVLGPTLGSTEQDDRRDWNGSKPVTTENNALMATAAVPKMFGRNAPGPRPIDPAIQDWQHLFGAKFNGSDKRKMPQFSVYVNQVCCDMCAIRTFTYPDCKEEGYNYNLPYPDCCPRKCEK